MPVTSAAPADSVAQIHEVARHKSPHQPHVAGHLGPPPRTRAAGLFFLRDPPSTEHTHVALLPVIRAAILEVQNRVIPARQSFLPFFCLLAISTNRQTQLPQTLYHNLVFLTFQALVEGIDGIARLHFDQTAHHHRATVDVRCHHVNG